VDGRGDGLNPGKHKRVRAQLGSIGRRSRITEEWGTDIRREGGHSFEMATICHARVQEDEDKKGGVQSAGFTKGLK